MKDSKASKSKEKGGKKSIENEKSLKSVEFQISS